MKKAFLFVIVILLIFIAACKPAAQAPGGDVMQKKDIVEKPAATGDAAVDAVGSDLNNVNNVEKDLSADDLNDLDSGLSDVENI